MKKEITVCDRCNHEYYEGEGLTFSIKKGYEMDPSGNGYNPIWKSYDFCRGCMTIHMQILSDERKGFFLHG